MFLRKQGNIGVSRNRIIWGLEIVPKSYYRNIPQLNTPKPRQTIAVQLFLHNQALLDEGSGLDGRAHQSCSPPGSKNFFHMEWCLASWFAKQADSEPLRICPLLWDLQLPPGMNYSIWNEILCPCRVFGDVLVTSSLLTDVLPSFKPAFCSSGSMLRFSP